MNCWWLIANFYIFITRLFTYIFKSFFLKCVTESQKSYKNNSTYYVQRIPTDPVLTFPKCINSLSHWLSLSKEINNLFKKIFKFIFIFLKNLLRQWQTWGSSTPKHFSVNFLKKTNRTFTYVIIVQWSNTGN